MFDSPVEVGQISGRANAVRGGHRQRLSRGVHRRLLGGRRSRRLDPLRRVRSGLGREQLTGARKEESGEETHGGT